MYPRLAVSSSAEWSMRLEKSGEVFATGQEEGQEGQGFP